MPLQITSMRQGSTRHTAPTSPPPQHSCVHITLDIARPVGARDRLLSCIPALATAIAAGHGLHEPGDLAVSVILSVISMLCDLLPQHRNSHDHQPNMPVGHNQRSAAERGRHLPGHSRNTRAPRVPGNRAANRLPQRAPSRSRSPGSPHPARVHMRSCCLQRR